MTVHKKTEKKTKTESPVKPKKVASKHVKNKKDKKDKKDRKVKKVEQKDKKDKKEKNVKKGSKSDPNAVAKIKKNKKDKKSKDKKPKDKKSKEKKPKAAKSKEVKSKDVKPKDVKSKDEKKKKKNSKGKKPSTDPLFSGPLTQAPKRSKGETQELNQLLENNAQNKPKKVKEPSGIDAIDLKSDSLVVEKTQLSGDSALRVTAKEKKKTKKTEIVVKEVKEEKKKDTGSVSEDENDIKAFQAEKSKEIETKKNEEMEKKQEEPKVKPVPPGTTPDTTTTTPEKKVSNLYKILSEVSDSKSITDSNIKPELDEIPEARTPEAEGPPMMVKERSEKRLKIESTQDTDDSDPKKVKSGPKKIRPESFKLKKTQSFSPVNIVSTVPDQVKKPGKNSPKDEHVMKTPPIENPVAAKKNPFDPLRSELETPIQEPAFVVNRGDTKIKNMEIKLVNLDLVGRTGMYMERCGMNAERKEAFDWLAYNRHDLNNKQKEFSQNLSVALSDIGITKELLMRTIIYLKSHNQITPSEMDMVLKDVKGCKGDTVSFSQLSVFLQSHCAVYKKHTNSKDH